jgi:UDP-N-acetylmuramoyl-tripeptide--D-alanyl-D-alanine ligase
MGTIETIDELASAVCGSVVQKPSAHWRLETLSTDSRTVTAGDLFVALRGATFDGNDFLDAAVARGAGAVVCGRGRSLAAPGIGFVEVDDTLRALGDLAATHRRSFDIPVVAITGSNGKTTTKEILRSILRTAYGAPHVLANEGNFNNLIGLPLTVMQLGRQHRAAVLEMGMNAPGEIARLTEIARPTHGLITCVGPAHLEGLGSIEGVALAKGELFEGLPTGSTALVNLEDPHVVRAAERFSGEKVGFGDAGAVRAERVVASGFVSTRFELVTDRGAVGVELPLAGRHNVGNAVAAAACALALGLDLDTIAAGLASTPPPPMRLAVEALANGVTIVNDAYNANPGSLAAAFDTVAAVAPGRLLVVVGEMRELGDQAASLHAEAGRRAAFLSPVLLCALGEHAPDLVAGARNAGLAADRTLVAGDHAAAARAVSAAWRTGDTVLIKGSRGSQMELVVEELRQVAGA